MIENKNLEIAKLPLQKKLMEHLKQCVPKNISLADELSELLDLSNDSVYRRLRCETMVSMDELALICSKFKLSFDSFLQQSESGNVTFAFKRLNSGADSYMQYLQEVLKDLKYILSFEEKKIIYAAEDIPVFYHFLYPKLAAFKMFYWQKSIMNEPSFENKQFDFELIDSSFIDITKEIFACYSNIPSIEIWSEETINSTLKQIEFYWESGILPSKTEALEICDYVAEMFNHILKQAETNTKILQNGNLETIDNFTLYQSDIMIGTNCILVNTNQGKASYLSFHTFNTMSTANASFCTETELWLENMVKKSNLISGVAQKQRYQFFKRMHDKLDLLKEKIAGEEV